MTQPEEFEQTRRRLDGSSRRRGVVIILLLISIVCIGSYYISEFMETRATQKKSLKQEAEQRAQAERRWDNVKTLENINFDEPGYMTLRFLRETIKDPGELGSDNLKNSHIVSWGPLTARFYGSEEPSETASVIGFDAQVKNWLHPEYDPPPFKGSICGFHLGDSEDVARRIIQERRYGVSKKGPDEWSLQNDLSNWSIRLHFLEGRVWKISTQDNRLMVAPNGIY